MHAAQGLGGVGVAGVPSAARDQGATDGDSPLRAKLAALEMEIEALKRGSDGGKIARRVLETEALKEALAQKGRTKLHNDGQN